MYVPLLDVSQEERAMIFGKAHDQVGKGYSLSMMKLFRKSKR